MVTSVMTFLDLAWDTTVELAPSLLLGLLLAGVLHRWVPEGRIRSLLGARGWKPVFLAAFLGVPLPLCSCGVIPAALMLRRQGAGLGAVMAFLISTPQTGVDALLVTARFLGWPFALFKWGAALATGVLGGLLVEALSRRDKPVAPAAGEGRAARRQGVLSYAFRDLLGGLDRWIILGILLSALISVGVPAGSLSGISWVSGWGGLFLVLVISLPLYVCSTGSVPIAAALLGAGLPEGAALVFLMAGPASNTATLGAVGGLLGPKALGVYLSVVALASLLWGAFWGDLPGLAGGHLTGHLHEGASLWSVLAAVLLVLALLALRFEALRAWWRSRGSVRKGKEGGVFFLEGMRCERCRRKVEEILLRHDHTLVACDLESGRITCAGGGSLKAPLVKDLEQAGYRVLSGRERGGDKTCCEVTAEGRERT